MLRATPPLTKLATTLHGQRRILKTKLPVHKYIQMAVQSGSYKYPYKRPHYLGMQDLPRGGNPRHSSKREREEQLKARRGILDYPTEYEILTLNPPLPIPARIPVRMRKEIEADKRRRERRAKREEERRRLYGEGLFEEDEGTDRRNDGRTEVPPLDRLVRSYLRRHEQRQKEMSPSQVRREEEYYSRLLLGRDASDEGGLTGVAAKLSFQSPTSLRTAMGRKSVVVENAYAFALRQQQEILKSSVQNGRGQSHDQNHGNDSDGTNNGSGSGSGSGILTEEESVEKVERLLRQEARLNRRKGHEITNDIAEWRTQSDADADADSKANDAAADKSEMGNDPGKKYGSGSSSIPSILHSKPRTIRALSIWSARLRSIPYPRWTIGAATALDHWIAREVLGMDEPTWLAVLEGGGADGAHLEESSHRDGSAGIMERMRDIVTVRGALFPETLSGGTIGGGSGEGEVATELEEELLSGDRDATEKSIDELLASLGGLEDEDDEEFFKFDDDDPKDGTDGENGEGVTAEEVESIMDELQLWRQRNVDSPYEGWDADRKKEFDTWIQKYIATLDPEADATNVDMEGTRQALLSERPVDRTFQKQFWDSVRTETEAELFLQDYRAKAREQLANITGNDNNNTIDDELKSQLETILSTPYERQLQKLVDMSTLRPILDQYTHKYSSILLEGVEMEHLVPDPEGPIGLDDLGAELREELAKDWDPSVGTPQSSALLADASTPLSSLTATSSLSDSTPRFKIEMIPYGTDAYGTERAVRAREMYRLWNEHKANRAKFEEAMFKKGLLGLEEKRVPRTKKEKEEEEKARLEARERRDARGRK
ncbi:hypothetical protein ACHAXS_011756 [Conticribra weissflogii]